MNSFKISSTNKVILILAVAGLCLLIGAYANHFNNGFHFDDMHAIVNNIFIRDLYRTFILIVTERHIIENGFRICEAVKCLRNQM